MKDKHLRKELDNLGIIEDSRYGIGWGTGVHSFFKNRLYHSIELEERLNKLAKLMGYQWSAVRPNWIRTDEK